MPRSFYGRVGMSVDDPVTDKLSVLGAAVQEACIVAVTAGGQIIRDRAYELANVSKTVKGHAIDGTHMRDNIVVTPTETAAGASARISVSLAIVPYAAHQEFGDRGKPFIRPAVDETRDEVHETMSRVFHAELGVVMETTTAVRFRGIA